MDVVGHNYKSTNDPAMTLPPCLCDLFHCFVGG